MGDKWRAGYGIRVELEALWDTWREGVMEYICSKRPSGDICGVIGALWHKFGDRGIVG